MIEMIKTEELILLKAVAEKNTWFVTIKNWVYSYNFVNLVKAKQVETGNISIDKKNYKDLTIYFTRYVQSKSIKMPGLHYYELMKKN